MPTYATAIGSSSDRPVALAELVGILVNDGVRRPATTLTKIHFAGKTPYETLLERQQEKGEAVLAPEVARTMRKAMAEVVEQGTARRLNGVFKLADGTVLTVGGKTGSGDNRFETFNRSGGVISSRATNRTATFVFYIGERYYGVITAFVQGREAGNYHFTSSLAGHLAQTAGAVDHRQARQQETRRSTRHQCEKPQPRSPTKPAASRATNAKPSRIKPHSSNL